MKTIAATEAKQHFGMMLDEAMNEPVLVQKSGRPAVVMLNAKEYERLTAIEDDMLTSQIQQAEAKGYLGAEASAKLLGELLTKHAA